MKFLIDADLPKRSLAILQQYGHEAIDVRQIGLADADDDVIAARAKAEGFCLLSGDFGFADVRNYPPPDYPGIVVLEIPNDATAPFILAILEAFLKRDDLIQKIPGRLAIVSVARVRLRPK